VVHTKAMNDISNLYDFQADRNSKPTQIILMLHGLGSNGQDLIGLAPMMAEALPGTVFVSPDAPFPCDMVPPGYPNSYQWFSLQDRDPQKILKGVQTASPILETFIKQQLEHYDLTADRLALLGFSQGTMMSLYSGPRYETPIAGVLGYSGALVWEPDVNFQALHHIPVHLVHGEADDVVPVEAYHAARQALEGAEFEVSGHTVAGLPHSIDPSGIESGIRFLKDIFKI